MDSSEPIRRRGSGVRRRPDGRERGVAIFVPLGLRDLVEEIAARHRDGEPLDGIFRALVPVRAAAAPQALLDGRCAAGDAPAQEARAPVLDASAQEARAPVLDASADDSADDSPQASPGGAIEAPAPAPLERAAPVSTMAAADPIGLDATAPAPSRVPPGAPAGSDMAAGRRLPELPRPPREDREVAPADGGGETALVQAAACRQLRRARPLWVAGGAAIGVVLTVVAVSFWTPGGRGQGVELDRLKRQVRMLQDELRQAQEVTLEALDRANGAPATVPVDPLFRPLR